jgi:16S rRNA A1518/A1519 N6-dimethyltransferase RsmA/KsgA/DIM1 with predicted DNA glycosylase/AP lyase activity
MIESKNTYEVAEKIIMLEEPSENKYEHYFASKIIADFMITLATIKENSKILEPSSGKGIFIELLKKNGYINLSAFELDNVKESIFYVSFLNNCRVSQWLFHNGIVKGNIVEY